MGAILTFAIIGTAISALLVGSLMYGAVQFLPGTLKFTFLDTLYFGALISPTVIYFILYLFRFSQERTPNSDNEYKWFHISMAMNIA